MTKAGLAPHCRNQSRRMRLILLWGKRRNLLLAINAVGFDYCRILKAGKTNRVFNERRTNSDLNNAYRTLVRQGFVRKSFTDGEDCFTEMAKNAYSLETSEKASFL